MLQQILAACGAISIVGGAGAVIYKVVHPAFKFKNRVEKLEDHSEKDYKRIVAIEEMQRQQSKSLAALLNHQITGNGIENMKKIRDELLESIIDKKKEEVKNYEFRIYHRVLHPYRAGSLPDRRLCN